MDDDEPMRSYDIQREDTFPDVYDASDEDDL